MPRETRPTLVDVLINKSWSVFCGRLRGHLRGEFVRRLGQATFHGGLWRVTAWSGAPLFRAV